MSMILTNLVTPKVSAKLELLFNKASEKQDKEWKTKKSFLQTNTLAYFWLQEKKSFLTYRTRSPRSRRRSRAAAATSVSSAPLSSGEAEKMKNR
jgi:hypothetical protein